MDEISVKCVEPFLTTCFHPVSKIEHPYNNDYELMVKMTMKHLVAHEIGKQVTARQCGRYSPHYDKETNQVWLWFDDLAAMVMNSCCTAWFLAVHADVCCAWTLHEPVEKWSWVKTTNIAGQLLISSLTQPWECFRIAPFPRVLNFDHQFFTIFLMHVGFQHFWLENWVLMKETNSLT